MNCTAIERIGRRLPVVPVLLLVLSGCRADIPSGQGIAPLDLRFALLLNAYHNFDNWKLDPDGFRIPSSKFRSAWRVVDTGAVVAGFSRVVVVIDSVFGRNIRGLDSLTRTSLRYFHTAANGDVFEFGFVAHLLQEQDTLSAMATWDRLVSPSMPTSWVVTAGDSAGEGTVVGVLLAGRELVGTSVNGVPGGVLAYPVEIRGRNLAVRLWVSDSPSAFPRFRDDTPTGNNRIFQEMTEVR